ncbi:MAG: hypothetical protein R3B06_02090 [Kofleriaceae bacterium]
MSRLSLCTLSLVSATALAAPAHADRAPHRDGTVVTFGIGGGHLGCSDANGDSCNGSGPVQSATFVAEVGGMVGRNLALLAHLEYARHDKDNHAVSQTIGAAAVRAWVLPRLWLEGGIGVARARAEYDNGVVGVIATSDTVPGVVAGLGVEVIRSRDFALDVNLRTGTGLYRDDVNLYQTSLGLAATFF